MCRTGRTSTSLDQALNTRLPPRSRRRLRIRNRVRPSSPLCRKPTWDGRSLTPPPRLRRLQSTGIPLPIRSTWDGRSLTPPPRLRRLQSTRIPLPIRSTWDGRSLTPPPRLRRLQSTGIPLPIRSTWDGRSLTPPPRLRRLQSTGIPLPIRSLLNRSPKSTVSRPLPSAPVCSKFPWRRTTNRDGQTCQIPPGQVRKPRSMPEMVTGTGAVGCGSSCDPACRLLLVAFLDWRSRGACRTFAPEPGGKVSQNWAAWQIALHAPWFSATSAVLPELTAVINPAHHRRVPD